MDSKVAPYGVESPLLWMVGKETKVRIEKETRYCLVSDDDGHWYVCPLDKRTLFQSMVDNQDHDGIMDADWLDPVGGNPSYINFLDPQHG